MDPSKPDFDPLKALYSPDFTLPATGPVYDNVEQCLSTLSGRSRRGQGPRGGGRPGRGAGSSSGGPGRGAGSSSGGGENRRGAAENKKPEEEEAAELKRNFLPEQMPVPANRTEFKDVVRRMGEFAAGSPLDTLHRWRTEKLRVKIWTRNMVGVRGICQGFIVAFDKHWNLLLRDVDEEFTRKRKRKACYPLAAGGGADGLKNPPKSAAPPPPPPPSLLLPRDLPVDESHGSSVMRIVRIQGKYEVCVRHVPQVLLRGEHVVSVAKVGGQVERGGEGGGGEVAGCSSKS